MMKAGDIESVLTQDDSKKGRDCQKGIGTRLFIGTAQDINQVAERAKQAGPRFDSEPHDTEWGTRAFDVTEPSGFKITIGSEEK